MFMGFSKVHSATVGLMLNTSTLSITPQFHVVHDDNFSTVDSTGDVDFAKFERLLVTPHTRVRVPLEDPDSVILNDDWLTPSEQEARDAIRVEAAHGRSRPERNNNNNEYQVQELPTPAPTSIETIETPVPSTPTTTNPIPTPISVVPTPSPAPSLPSVTQQPTRRSGRSTNPTKLFDPGTGSASQWRDNHIARMATIIQESSFQETTKNKLYFALSSFDSDISATRQTPLCYKTKKVSDPDLPNYKEAMSGDYAQEFKHAMNQELESLVKRDTWSLVPRGDHKTIPGTWAFRIKRKPDGSLNKFKARFCVRGDLQQKYNLAEPDTYAPVVNWSTIRLMLVLTQQLNLSTVHLDFSNAFAQADIPEGSEVYLEPPPRYATQNDMVLKLNKSLYGQVEAPQLWYNKLKEGLIDRGLKLSDIDPCLFIGSNVCAVIYVDDVVFFARDKNNITNLIKTFKDDGNEFNWEHTIEGDLHSFLGVTIQEVKKQENGKQVIGWKFTQSGLIKKILQATGMVYCNGKDSPTESTKVLGSDTNGHPSKEEWKYGSIIGMMLYLAANSRPDIAFAVHQSARFTHAPKRSHEQAVLRICRYLQATKDEGLIYWPSQELQVDCYCDADLAGLWSAESPDDPISVKSRTGYVIMVAGCPVIWASKLQSLIALSTLESEYISLSTALRDMIPLKTLLKELCTNFALPTNVVFNTHSTVYEDNNGALRLATTQAMTPRTKHIAIIYHWFRTHVQQKTVSIKKIDTKIQTADIFTKPLGTADFQRLRFLLSGW